MRGQKEIVLYLSLLPSEEKNYRDLVRRFEYTTGLKVRLVSQQYNQIKQAIISEVKAGSGVVDIFEADLYYLRDLSKYTYDLKELEDYFNTQNLYKKPYKAGRINGRLCFIPHRISCQAMVYNSNHIQDPPGSWRDFVDILDRLPEKIGIKASLYEGLVCDIFPIVWSMQGNILDLRNKNTMEALNIIKSLEGKIHPGSKAFKENSILEAQAREEIYLHFNWPFAVNYLEEKGMFPEPNKIAPLPQGKVKASVLGGGYLAVSKAAPHKSEAMGFIKFIEAQSSQTYLVKNLGWMPTRDDVWPLLDNKTKEAYSAFIEALKYARPRPAIKDYERVSQVWQRIFHALVFDKRSIKEVVEDYSKELEQLSLH